MKRSVSVLIVLVLSAGCVRAMYETPAPSAALDTTVPLSSETPYAEELALLLDEIEAILEAMSAKSPADTQEIG